MARFRNSRTLVIVSVLVAAASVVTVTQGAVASHDVKNKARFMSWNTKKHTVSLSLTAGLTSANHTLNFNGYTSGGMIVSVPKGYRVIVKFANHSTFPHSAVFTRRADISSSAHHPLAFPHASSPKPLAGTSPGAHLTFSFVAKRVGTYAIICEVDHHADAGMWEVFKVTKGTHPSIKLKKAAVNASATPTPTPYY